MHNMMVETRIEPGEEERADLYALNYAETPVVDTAVETEERLEAKHGLRAAILQARVLDDASLYHQRSKHASLWFRCIQQQWKDLHEAEKHFWLQAAIRRQLAMNCQLSTV